jgi:hypothetical protein
MKPPLWTAPALDGNVIATLERHRSIVTPEAPPTRPLAW